MSDSLNDVIAYAPLTKYELEKEQGLRRPTGARLLKKLTGKHKRIANMHLSGMTGVEIATAMGMSQVAISNILTDPLMKELLDHQFSITDMELRALMIPAVTAVKDALDCEDINVRLTAADKVFRTQGLYSPKNEGGAKVSAEDLVRKLLENTQSGETTRLAISVQKD